MAQLVRLTRGKGDRVPAVVNLGHLKDTEVALTLGRAETCGVTLRSTAGGRGCLFSRVHATVRHANGVYTLKDHSVNGTFINNVRISEAILRHSDILSFGTGGDVQVGQALPTPPLVSYRFCDDTELQPSTPTAAAAASTPCPGVSLSRVVCIAPQAEFIPTPPTRHSPIPHGEPLDITIHLASLPTSPKAVHDAPNLQPQPSPELPPASYIAQNTNMDEPAAAAAPAGPPPPPPTPPPSPPSALLPPTAVVVGAGEGLPSPATPPPTGDANGFPRVVEEPGDSVGERFSAEVVGVRIPTPTSAPAPDAVHPETAEKFNLSLADATGPDATGVVGTSGSIPQLPTDMPAAVEGQQHIPSSVPVAPQASASGERGPPESQTPSPIDEDYPSQAEKKLQSPPPQLGQPPPCEPVGGNSFLLHQPSDLSGVHPNSQQPTISVPSSAFMPIGATVGLASPLSMALFESAVSSSVSAPGTLPPTPAVPAPTPHPVAAAQEPTPPPPPASNGSPATPLALEVAATPSPVLKAAVPAPPSSVRCVPETPAVEDEVMESEAEVHDLPGSPAVCRNLEIALEQQQQHSEQHEQHGITPLEPTPTDNTCCKAEDARCEANASRVGQLDGQQMDVDGGAYAAHPSRPMADVLQRLESDSSVDHVPVLRPKPMKRTQPPAAPRPKQPKLDPVATVPDEEWLIEGDDEDDCPGAVDWLIGSGSEGDTDFVKPSHLPDDVPEASCESSSSSQPLAHPAKASQAPRAGRPSHVLPEPGWPTGRPAAPQLAAPPAYVAAPRTAFGIFFAEVKERLRRRGERGWTVAALREEIGRQWAVLGREERGDYLAKEEREREHFERLSPKYRQKQSQAPPRRPRWKVGVGPLAPPKAAKLPASPEGHSPHQQYRQQVAALHQQRAALEAEALARLQAEEGHLRSESAGAGEAASQSRPRRRSSRGAAPTGETCTIEDVGGYLQDHPGSRVPLTRRVLNAGHRPGDPVEVMPCQLADLLKPHQLEGVRFLWANVVMPAPLPAPRPEPPAEHPVPVVQGCILAHAMGLGKTLTSVAFTLMYLRHRKGRTVLVVAPKSTLHNWRQEFRQWAERAGLAPPRLWLLDDRVKGAPKRLEVLQQWVAQGGVLIVGYALFVQLVGERSAGPVPPRPGSTPARKRQRLTNPGPRLSQAEVLIGDSDEEDACVQELVRASYACNEEDDREARQVLSEAAAPPPGEPLDDQAAAFRELLTVQAPDCLIVDEGHKLANPKACLTQALNRVATRQRIICTGTPIQNNLWEYYSMVDFVRPGYWGRREFAKLYASTIRPRQAPTASPERLRQMEHRSKELYTELAKFVHRRDVGLLLRELPPIREFIIAVPLSQIQAKVYADFVAHGLKACKDKTKLQTRRVLVLSSVLQKIGNHPDLARQYCIQKGVDPADAWDAEDRAGRDEFSFTQQERERQLLSRTHRDFSWARPLFARSYRLQQPEHSTKMLALLEIIGHCMQLGEKVLVFSQWASTLDMIEAVLQSLPPPASAADVAQADAFDDEGRWTLGREYLRFDGEASTSKRQAIMQHFNDPASSSRLLLCCVKAGGLGINLPGATRVVLFDPSWNPQADQQAIYRAYRYGQTRPVFVYRLMNEGTVEQAIFQKTYSKVFLFRCIVDDDSVQWHRRELNSLRYVGAPPTSALRIDHRLLEEDPVLKRLFDRRLMCSVESHETLFASEDEQLLGVSADKPTTSLT